jgi:hypothetical protein
MINPNFYNLLPYAVSGLVIILCGSYIPDEGTSTFVMVTGYVILLIGWIEMNLGDRIGNKRK